MNIIRFKAEGDNAAFCAYCECELENGRRAVQVNADWFHEQCAMKAIAAGMADLNRSMKNVPKAPEAEASVVSGCLVDEELADLACAVLVDQDFFYMTPRHIFRAMQSLRRKEKPVDVVTVVEELRAMDVLDDVGGVVAVTKLVEDYFPWPNEKEHITLVLAASLKRYLIHAGETLITNGRSLRQVEGELEAALEFVRKRQEEVRERLR